MSQKGIKIPVHWTRTLISDIVHYATKVPLCTIEKQINIEAVQIAKSTTLKRIGWTSVFTKAMGLASVEFNELRQSWMPFPFAHLYQHPFPIASVAINRIIENKEAVIFGMIQKPEEKPLTEITDSLHYFKDSSIDSVSLLKRMRRTSKFPWPIRAIIWNYGLYLSGYCKAKNFGTFSVSSVSQLNSNTIQLLTPLTSALNYGPISNNGDCIIRLTFDHRVMDGLTVAKILSYIEQTINSSIREEVENQDNSKVA
ncbi:MAG: hypothetical protein EBT92_14560 [Planctomycetes bacterium]|nr:hypothetical protein [Planctomycetota bacterium]